MKIFFASVGVFVIVTARTFVSAVCFWRDQVTLLGVYLLPTTMTVCKSILEKVAQGSVLDSSTSEWRNLPEVF